jgi:uncharacterized protein YukE
MPTNPVSADSEGQQAAATMFNTHCKDISHKINQLQIDVNDMKYDSAAATTFKQTHDQWHIQAEKLVGHLDEMAEILRTNAVNQTNTESDNVSVSKFW